MLEIRAGQLRHLNRAARQVFHRDVLISLRRRLPLQTEGRTDEELLEAINAGHEVASMYRIESTRGVTQFITLGFLAGPEFHRLPPVNEFLRRPKLSGDQKMNLLTAALPH
jgi:hypothetical protein